MVMVMVMVKFWLMHVFTSRTAHASARQVEPECLRSDR